MTKIYHNRWTPEKKAELDRDYNSVKDLNVLAEKYNLTLGSLKAVLVHFGISRGRKFQRKWSAEMNYRVRTEFPTTKFPRVLASELGVTMGALRNHARKLGLKREVPAYRPRGLKNKLY